MLAIKLKITGRKNQRTFRVIVQETREKLDGKNVEDLGWYNPHTNQFKVNKDRAEYWISNGAQPTDSAARLLEKVKSVEIGSYEPRKGRKKKKGPKGEAEATAPVSEVSESVPQAEGVAPAADNETKAEETEIPTETEAPAEAETPTEEAAEPEKEEDVEEKKEGE